MCHLETSYDKWCWDESIEQGKNDLQRQSWFDQKLIWVLQWLHCFKICVAQHWGGRGHITVTTKVWGVNLKNFLENSREAVSVSTIFDEYCGIQNSRLSWISLRGGSKTSRYSDQVASGADLGGGCRGCAPLPEMTCGFLIQLVFCKKKNYVVYWCWSRARDECTPS